MKAVLFSTVCLAFLGAQTAPSFAQNAAVSPTVLSPAEVMQTQPSSPVAEPQSAASASSAPVPSASTPSQDTAAQANPSAGSVPVGTDGSTTAAPVIASWEGPVPDAYLGTAPAMGSEQISVWLATPRSLLDMSPTGGGAMVRMVRSLLGTDNRTVLPLVDLAKTPDVNDDQIESVAIGFASAVFGSEGPAPEYAAYLQWAVAQSGSEKLIAAFEKASGADDEATASINSFSSRSPGAPGSGSLAGTGTIGPSGPIGSVPQGTTIQQAESGNLLRLASGRVSTCRSDTSPVGCF